MEATKIKVYRNSKPVRNVKVSLEFNGVMQSGFSKSAYTNANGVALVSHSSTGKANVWIDGKKRGTMNTPGSDVYYI